VTAAARPLGDEVLVRRAARGIAMQAAGLVAVAMLLLVALATFVVVRGQASAADTLLRSTVSTADDVGDPPPETWIVLERGDQLASSPGLPEDIEPALRKLREQAIAQRSLADISGTSGRTNRAYRVATQRRSGETVQAVLDLTSQHQQRARLLKTMGLASLLGLAFAGLLGVLLARRAVRPLAAALTLQRTFVADASHELRTPLTLLSTRSQLLDRAIQASVLDPQVRDDSRGVVHDVQRLGEVVDDLLLAADPRGDDRSEPVGLAGLVEAVLDSARAHAGDAHVTLTSAADDPARLSVMGSAPALRRAVLALVENAIDHTPPGGEVAVRTRVERREVIVSVSDTGPGIAPEAAQDVLRRFHSGGQRAGRAHYGLGLALTHDVANRHGGQLRLAPSKRGATFELVLPAVGFSEKTKNPG
jgi:two-component system, OmpR family, sensor kinase